jgi:hypothetical protein
MHHKFRWRRSMQQRIAENWLALEDEEQAENHA